MNAAGTRFFEVPKRLSGFSLVLLTGVPPSETSLITDMPVQVGGRACWAVQPVTP